MLQTLNKQNPSFREDYKDNRFFITYDVLFLYLLYSYTMIYGS